LPCTGTTGNDVVAKKSCGESLPTCYSNAIMTTATSTPETNKVQQAEAAFAQLMADASRRGFYGTAGLTLSIQDGRIQHIRLAVESMIK
jgi:hypothetical protein